MPEPVTKSNIPEPFCGEEAEDSWVRKTFRTAGHIIFGVVVVAGILCVLSFANANAAEEKFLTANEPLPFYNIWVCERSDQIEMVMSIRQEEGHKAGVILFRFFEHHGETHLGRPGCSFHEVVTVVPIMTLQQRDEVPFATGRRSSAWVVEIRYTDDKGKKKKGYILSPLRIKGHAT